jgi:phage terminase large subunit
MSWWKLAVQAMVKLKINPREPFRAYLERVQRWACMVVHRRGGKTFVCVQDLLARSQTHKRPGPALRYAYVAPTRDQAKDIAWGYVKDFFCKIPGTITNEADLKVTTPNGASLRLYSGENYERMRGLYFDGVVIDEPADIDPAAWNTVIRPTLTDYNGWATWIGTPKGRNAFWRQWTKVSTNPDWFTLLLKASESGLIPERELRDIMAEIPERDFLQEYECSFAVARPGAIYAKQLEDARAAGRINSNVMHFKEVPAYTSFDVGAAANQKVWIWQMVGDRINYLQCLSGGDDCKTPADWAGRLRNLGYNFGAHFLPHDACSKHGGLWQDGFEKANLSNVVPVPRQVSVWDGINLAVDAIPRTYFNADGCEMGIDALDAYHSKEDRDGATIKDIPVHDWASHYADAFSLSHQAIRAGLVVDRTAIPSRARGVRGQVIGGLRDTRPTKVIRP